ncbi:hypothetical protein [Carboxylicivirga linearis]|uniref:Outer membrane protein beta-barrel domain-containing protein n=1 Tax=Carboxylicivirga linearis TaxID=1628157 RepID=A0ABS5JTA4_9BACT|nr:hypothetical protein [Carboxylicivirga linearis]MBS2098148.1 hypothetical protein [Carboxylicivirga linearis]
MKKILILALALMSINAWAQHSEHHSETTHETHQAEEAHHGKHKLAFYYGFTHVPSAFYEHETHVESTGKWVPTIGIDYYYALNKRWDLGLIGDAELDQYYIRTSEEDELERANVVVVSAVAKYKATKRIGIFAGPGFETEFKKEEAKSFFVFKAGIEYEVEIEKGWELAPILSYDFKEEYSSYAFGISIGKRF